MPKPKTTTAPAWPGAEIKMKRLDDLAPSPHNSRTHSDDQIEAVAASQREFGWTVPILVDEGGQILAGHARYAAARRNGFEEGPCIVATGWSEEQKRAYIIADNKLTERGGWDLGKLAEEFGALSDSGFDLGFTGFEEEEVEGILADDPVLPQRTEALRPIKMTHILISLPTGVDPGFLDDALAKVKAEGGKVDHGGN